VSTVLLSDRDAKIDDPSAKAKLGKKACRCSEVVSIGSPMVAWALMPSDHGDSKERAAGA